MTTPSFEPGDAWLVYDGECPVCTNWCRYARLRDSVGTLHLVDARQGGPLMDQITRQGLDIDQGMVLQFHNTLYYGPDAIRMMSLLSSPSGVFNRINALFFGGPRRANIFYPLGKMVRNVVLKVMGISYIDNLGAGRSL